MGVANTTADHLFRNNNSLFFHRIWMLYCCQPHSQLHCCKSPTSKVQIGHQHTSVTCSFLPSTQSSSFHTQASSTHKLYITSIQQYLSFCQCINHTPHLLSNSHYCYLFYTSLKAKNTLVPSRFTYLQSVAFTLPQTS